MPKLAAWLKLDSQPASAADRRLANRFLRYWEELKGDRRYPSPTDLDFDDISEFIPHAFNVDLSTGIGDPTIRFAGKNLSSECGGDVTNKTLSELPPLTLLAQTAQRVGEVVTSGEPVFVSDRFITAQDREVLFRAVMLPFSTTGIEIDYVIGAVNCKSARFTAAAQAWEATRARAREAGSGHRSPAPRAVPKLAVPEPRSPAPPDRKDASDLIGDVEKAVGAAPLTGILPVKAPSSAEAEGAGPAARPVRARPIVVGSAKDGIGKSTTAMNLIVSLLDQGHAVGSIDLDIPQQTLSRFVENRQALNRRRGLSLAIPDHVAFRDRDFDEEYLATEFGKLLGRCAYIVIDTPTGTSALSRWAHSWADNVITLIDDSISELDRFATFDASTRKVVTRDHYAEMIARARGEKAGRSGGSFDWIVIRNRPSDSGPLNEQRMADALGPLAEFLDFRNERGFSERVIYSELFLLGLTLADLEQNHAGIVLSKSHDAARLELRALLQGLRLDQPAVPS